jgi:hypothetical protein
VVHWQIDKGSVHRADYRGSAAVRHSTLIYHKGATLALSFTMGLIAKAKQNKVLAVIISVFDWYRECASCQLALNIEVV